VDRRSLSRGVQARSVPRRISPARARPRQLQGGRQGSHHRRSRGAPRPGHRSHGCPQAEPGQARRLARGDARAQGRDSGGRPHAEEASREGGKTRGRAGEGREEGSGRQEVTHFTTREVAKIALLPDARIRSCVRAGVLAPHRDRRGRLEWTFQDLLLLKTTKGLLDARVPLARIKRMVGSLRRQLPDDQTLSSVTIYADGQHVVAWDGAARWQPDSGQFLFNFDVQAVASKAKRPEPAPTPKPAATNPTTRTAEQWFNLGCELDTTSPEEARHAYHQALELDPGLADAHVNLGRLYHEAEHLDRPE